MLNFKFKNKTLASGNKTRLCAIINVTPDSFSDGGKYFALESAIDHVQELLEAGVDMLDIGGESTRPGSHYVEIDDEISRVCPLIEEIRKFSDIPISVDTWKSQVAKAALDSGADIVNDISGLLADENMANTVAQKNAGLILMFNPVIARPEHTGSKIFPTFGKNPFTKEELDSFKDMPIFELMIAYFNKALLYAENAGIAQENIMLDPGIGFGLTKKENLELINKLPLLKNLGFFTFVGVSRKRFIANIIEENNLLTYVKGDNELDLRDEASACLTTIAALSGIDFLRVHTLRHHMIAKTIADYVKNYEQLDDLNFKAYKGEING